MLWLLCLLARRGSGPPSDPHTLPSCTHHEQPGQGERAQQQQPRGEASRLQRKQNHCFLVAFSHLSQTSAEGSLLERNQGKSSDTAPEIFLEKMAKFLPVLLFATQLSLTAALFRVSVIQPHYSAEYGSNVTMGCRFPTDNSLNLTQLNIFWQQKLSDEAKEVYKLQNGREDLSGQHQHFQGRATLLYEELKRGYSMLHITHLRITDAGYYLCVVNYREADHKYIDLKIEAPYKRINIQERKEEDDHILTCQAEGYPLADVLWLYENRINDTIYANTTHKLTDTGLFNITSVLRIKPNAPGNYSCIFQNKELRQTSAHRTVFLIGQRNGSGTGKNSMILFIPTILYSAMILFTITKV